MIEDHYDVLGVGKSATPDQIKRSYLHLAWWHHPDLTTGRDTAMRYRRISEAYRILIDPDSRALYDSRINQTESASNQRISRLFRKNACATRDIGWDYTDRYLDIDWESPLQPNGAKEDWLTLGSKQIVNIMMFAFILVLMSYFSSELTLSGAIQDTQQTFQNLVGIAKSTFHVLLTWAVRIHLP